MRMWHEAQLHHLQGMAERKDIVESALDLARDLGFDYATFVTGPGQVMPHRMALNNMPAAWRQRYRQQGYGATDPSVRHCRHSVVPLLWTDGLFRTTPEFRQDAWNHGIRHGLSLAIHDSDHQVSMLTLARQHLPVSADEFCAKVGQCLWLGNLLHQRLGARQASADGDTHGQLSGRELEILRWSAEGKTAGDIATILSLSERTVNFHISTAVKKMGMGNKLSAVVHAAQTGLL